MYKLKIGLLNDLMYKAIISNNTDFVKLFLDQGFSLKNFLTYRLLLKLYNDPSILQTALFVKILNRKKYGEARKAVNFKSIGLIIEALVNQLYSHKFTRLPFSSISYDQACIALEETVLQNWFYF